ncbi:MAG: M14 family metallopeptidase [Eubacteriales bacterium]|nr:M14 family metallopeptidase [Eubacteriales bacterium]
MIKTVVSAELPVEEHLLIRKNRLEPEELGGKEKRISIVTGTHGDELEGQFVCYEMNRRIRENPKALKGIVDIYPALNPLGIDSITRGVPMFDLDMNRIFPGMEKGPLMETVASQIVADLKGSDVCIDIHASNIFLMEIPQVRISEETADTLVPLAKLLNVDFIWVHASATVLESTLAHSLNDVGVPTLVVEMGVGMRITKRYCEQLVDGIFSLMKELGIWEGPVTPVKEPIVSTDHEVEFINANAAGIFVPAIEHGDLVKKGQHLGDILSPLTGEVEERINAGVDGMVFTRREYPVVYSGSLLARILGGIRK